MAAVNPFIAHADEWQLAAYVVLNESAAQVTDPGALLRPFLEDKLPEYMVPSAYVAINALPHTDHGKLNRQQLPPPDVHRLAQSRIVEPRTLVEEEIAAIWRDLLQVKQISIDENFFRLGGHSLLATRVVAHIRSSFQIELPLRALFESPTIRGLAERVEDILLASITENERNRAAPDMNSVREEFLL